MFITEGAFCGPRYQKKSKIPSLYLNSTENKSMGWKFVHLQTMQKLFVKNLGYLTLSFILCLSKLYIRLGFVGVK